jgi:O-antigen/teichoic acid export membrane protein
MTDSMRRLARFRHSALFSNSIYLLAGNALGALSGFIFWALAARLYPAETVGIASASISAIALLASISHLGMGYGLIKFLPGRNPHDASRLINASLIIGLALGLLAAGIYLAGLDIWSSRLITLRQNPLLLAGFTGIVLAAIASSVLDNTLISQRKSKYVTLRGIIFNLGKIGMLLVLVRYLSQSGVLVSWGVALVVSLIFTAIFLLPRALPGYRLGLVLAPKGLKPMLGYSLANNVTAFLLSGSGTLLPLLVLQRVGAAGNAYFYMAWAMAATLGLAASSVATALFAEGAHNADELAANTWRALWMVLALMIPMAAVALLMGKPVLGLLGPGYDSAAPLFYWLVAGLFPLSVNQVFFGVLRVQSRLKELTLLSALILVVTITGSYFLLPRYGLQTAGWSWFAGQSAAALWVVLGNRRFMHVKGKLVGLLGKDSRSKG